MVYEALFKHLLFPAFESLVKQRQTARYVREGERNQWLAPSALHALQLQRLNALLDHCWAQVPFLKTYWSDHGVRAGALGHVDELAAYPTLTKQLMSANYEQMVAGNWRGRTMTKQTGGSTGDPFRFEYTMDSYARRTAAMWRGYGWAGGGLGARTAYMWGTGMRQGGWGGLKDRLYHGAFNRRFLNVFSMTPADVDLRIDELLAYQPEAVVGYVAPLGLLARRMIETGRHPRGLRGVITAAEALYEEERVDIERAFQCKAFNSYGSREVMLMAAECDHHQGLHVTADHMLLEIVDEHGQLKPAGQSGEVAVTDFFNLGMPMVRYLNGDCAQYATAPCGCGRGLPLLKSIDGRVLDIIRAPDGRALSGENLVAIALGYGALARYQGVQTAEDLLEFRVVLARPWADKERSNLLGALQQAAGTSMRVELVEVGDIPTNATGKRRISVSLKNAHTVPPLPNRAA